jgi:predicted SprT family Zn-dependent metalloprotease
MELNHVWSDRALDCSSDLNSLATVWAHPRVSSLRVVVNKRLQATLARWMPPADVIQVSPAAAERGQNVLRQIVAHEAAHVVVWDRYGRIVRPHGPEWMDLMRAAGTEPQAVLMRCGERYHRKAPSLCFRHFCPVCHFERMAKRRVATWRCPECQAIGLPGGLNVEQIFAAHSG